MNTPVAIQQDAPGGMPAPVCPVSTSAKAFRLKRTTVLVAWVVLPLAVVHPPHGLGVPLCWFRAATGAPCWGCGLSRSFSCCVRGMFSESWAYHPFGIVFVTLLVGVAVGSVLPRSAGERVARLLDSRRRTLGVGYAILVATFLVFGTVRALWYLLWPMS